LPLLGCPAPELLEELRSEFCDPLLEVDDLLLEVELEPEFELRSHFPYSLCDR